MSYMYFTNNKNCVIVIFSYTNDANDVLGGK